MSMYPLCGEIDICLRGLKKKAVFTVGVSRSGKSTLYNNANHAILLGVAPEGS